MQFGNGTLVLLVDAVATVCSIVPTYSSMLKQQGGHSEREYDERGKHKHPQQQHISNTHCIHGVNIRHEGWISELLGVGKEFFLARARTLRNFFAKNNKLVLRRRRSRLPVAVAACRGGGSFARVCDLQ
jgi:hypothetical protein